MGVMVLGHRGMLGRVVRRRWRELMKDDPYDYVVNCIRPDDLYLSERLPGPLIQPSTDAIAEDTEYAATKRKLEAIAHAVTIRAGIVDITRQPSVAYTDWLCNPLTPLEWADLAYEMRYQQGVHVAGREPLSRYDVAVAVSSIFGTPAPSPGTAGPLSRVQRPDRIRPPLWDALIAYRDWLG